MGSSDTGSGAQINRLSVTPRSAQVMVGDSIRLQAYAHLGDGDSAAVAAEWTSSIGPISPLGWLHADRGGVAVVRGTSTSDPSLTDSAAIAIATVALIPSDTVVVTDGTISVIAQSIDPTGAIQTPSVTWSTTGGSVSPAGVYTAPADPGIYEIVAKVTDHAASASLRLNVRRPVLAFMVLNPTTVSLAAGASMQFSIAALWSDGSTAPPVVTWSATGGTISPSGLFAAGTIAGTFHVIASAGGIIDTSRVAIAPPPPTLTRITLSPHEVTLSPAALTQYGVVGTWSDGSTTTPAVTYAATGGSISPSGVYTAGATGGTYRVIATEASGHADTAAVTIAIPAATLIALVVNPHSLTLAPGAVQPFGVAAAWSDGSSNLPALAWSASGGTISSGVYTAGATPGTYRIVAAQQGGTKADTAIVTIAVPPATLTTLTIAPKLVTVNAGATQQFGVGAQWSDGSMTAPALTWTATGGSISTSGLYTAGSTAGNYRVIATQQGGTKADTSAVTVTVPPPTLVALVLNPSSVTLLTGATQQFAVSTLWSDSSTTAPSLTWTASGGTISAGGVYTAGTTAGTYRVIATQQGGGKADTSSVVVSLPAPTVTKLTIAPETATVNTGSTQQFTVSALWSDGSTTVPGATWNATGGTISATGLYTAGATAGSYHVIVTQQGGGKADTAAVTTAVTPPTLVTMVLNPSAVTLLTGGTQQFGVSALWSDNSTAAPALNWSATGGTIGTNGLYTAGATAGTYRVIATQQGGGKADTSSVVVVLPAPTLTELTIAPKTATVNTGSTQQFTVSALWSDGSTAVPALAWTATAGTISGTGLYTAGATAGSYQVVVTSPAGGKADTAAVSLTQPTLTTLRALASARGFSIGAAVRDTAFSNDATYRQTLQTQYNSIVPEDATDFWPIHPGPSQYSFAAADALVAFAAANGMAFHGHHLSWYAWIPDWITKGGYTDAQLRAILKDHITTVVSRYRGHAASWDAVNEVENDAGTGLRSSFWVDHLGPEYIDSAFVWAHRADPNAKLYLNEYGTETINPKSTGILNLVLGLRARGVPIDGVGFQVHVYQQFSPVPTSAQVQASFQRFADAGFDIRITEMDADIPDGAGAAALAAQGTVYRDVLNACLNVPRCKEMTTWGFTDRYSYVSGTFPGYGRALPFDINYQPKPAFDSLLARLRL